MANVTLPAFIGTRSEIHALERGQDALPWQWTPELVWRCRVRATDVLGANASRSATITIPASGFVSGRLTMTFVASENNSLVSDVVLTADAAVGDSEIDLGAAATTAIQDAFDPAGDLEGLGGVTDNADGTVQVDFIEGEHIDITLAFAPAQQTEIQLTGTLIDADYHIELDGGGLGAPVDSPTTRSGGSPANIAAMVVQIEADLEALIPTTLAGVLVSADDDGSDTNLLIFEPGIPAVTFDAWTDPQSIAIQFGGTATDGTYQSDVYHSSLPGSFVPVPTVRTGGTPATNLDLAVQHEADIEAESALFTVVDSANNDTVDSDILIGQPGVRGISVVTSAPSPGTLTQTPLALTVTDVTPAGPSVSVSYSVAIDLNDLQPADAFPSDMLRGFPSLYVTEAFPASSTATLYDASPASDDVIAGAAVDSTGWVGDTGTSLGDEDKTEGSWSPLLALSLGASAAPATGDLIVQVVMAPLPL